MVGFDSDISPKEDKKAVRVIKNVLISFGISALAVVLVVALPSALGVTIIPANARNIVPLLLLLMLVYFTLATVVGRFKCSKVIKTVTLSISMIVATILMVGVVYFVNTFVFFQSIDSGNDNDRITYAVVVRRESSYNSITELDKKSLGIMDGDEELEAIGELERALDLSFSLNATNSGVSDLAHNLTNGIVEAVCVEQGRLDFLYKEIDNFERNTRKIYTFKLRRDLYKTEEKVAISEEPFVVYISGIDQYGQTDSVMGRSDVNQLMVVNPKTRKILLANTPRDYYVQLAGTTGLKDKLTHAGIYGIETSLKTMEELYGIEINYYVRVNFDSLIKVVDQIGGINIVSDRAFKAYTDPSVYVQEGINTFNGKQALAYARERYAYESGDRHRGENQQQVMMVIIDKITGSPVLLKNYNNIIQSLTGSFQTDIPSDVLIGFIKKQIAEGGEWQIETVSVDGVGSTQPTYSMGSQPLYVMIPDEGSLATAKTKIAQVLSEE